MSGEPCGREGCTGIDGHALDVRDATWANHLIPDVPEMLHPPHGEQPTDLAALHDELTTGTRVECGSVNPETGETCTRAPHLDRSHWHGFLGTPWIGADPYGTREMIVDVREAIARLRATRVVEADRPLVFLYGPSFEPHIDEIAAAFPDVCFEPGWDDG